MKECQHCGGQVITNWGMEHCFQCGRTPDAQVPTFTEKELMRDTRATKSILRRAAHTNTMGLTPSVVPALSFTTPYS